MNNQDVREENHPSEYSERNDEDSIVPEKKSDRFADKFPVDPSEVHETAMGGTVAAVGPMNGPLPDEIPMFETPNQEIPMGGTLAAVGPMHEPQPEEIRIIIIPAEEIFIEKIPATGAPIEEPFIRNPGDEISYAEEIRHNQISPAIVQRDEVVEDEDLTETHPESVQI